MFFNIKVKLKSQWLFYFILDNRLVNMTVIGGNRAFITIGRLIRKSIHCILPVCLGDFVSQKKKKKQALTNTHQCSGVSDLFHNSIVSQALQWEPERKGLQLGHRLAGGQTCSQRLTQTARRWEQEEYTPLNARLGLYKPERDLRICTEWQQWQRAVRATGLVSGSYCHTW